MRILATFVFCYWLYWLYAFLPYSGSSPKQGSNVLFPGALPLASAGVGGYMCIYIKGLRPLPPTPGHWRVMPASVS